MKLLWHFSYFDVRATPLYLHFSFHNYKDFGANSPFLFVTILDEDEVALVL